MCCSPTVRFPDGQVPPVFSQKTKWAQACPPYLQHREVTCSRGGLHACLEAANVVFPSLAATVKAAVRLSSQGTRRFRRGNYLKKKKEREEHSSSPRCSGDHPLQPLLEDNHHQPGSHERALQGWIPDTSPCLPLQNPSQGAFQNRRLRLYTGGREGCGAQQVSSACSPALLQLSFPQHLAAVKHLAEPGKTQQAFAVGFGRNPQWILAQFKAVRSELGLVRKGDASCNPRLPLASI